MDEKLARYLCLQIILSKRPRVVKNSGFVPNFEAVVVLQSKIICMVFEYNDLYLNFARKNRGPLAIM